MQVLYRKYRPVLFKDVTGQDHVTKTLQSALASGRISHAFLFCGTRGTGKTTVARLLAKALNCETLSKTRATTMATAGAGGTSSVPQLTPVQLASIEPCDTCASCQDITANRSIDLIEIDAASNRGIDEIRNIKESARVSPLASAYKVFIIDEVHMLSTPAFNALLKVLEEPPAHVVFILATTEPHKILDTILSRVQRFDFKKIVPDLLMARLTRIAKAENVQVEEPVYQMLATLSGGSLRDAETAFAKLISHAGNTITASMASDIFGIVPAQTYDALITMLVRKETKQAIDHINQVYESGINLEHFTDQFIRHLRTTLIASIDKPTAISSDFLVRVLTTLTRSKQELKTTPIPQLPLELAFIELTSAHVKPA